LELLEAVSDAKTRPGAVFYTQALLRLASIDDSGKPVRQFITINRLPAAELKSGDLRLVLPVDYSD